MKEFISKLGTSKGTKRARIWLQGKRLTDAGFKVGDVICATWNKASLTITPALKPSKRGEHDDIRKVSGKGDMPIIDIVGQRVVETFGQNDHVKVMFSKDRITIVTSK